MENKIEQLKEELAKEQERLRKDFLSKVKIGDFIQFAHPIRDYSCIGIFVSDVQGGWVYVFNLVCSFRYDRRETGNYLSRLDDSMLLGARILPDEEVAKLLRKEFIVKGL